MINADSLDLFIKIRILNFRQILDPVADCNKNTTETALVPNQKLESGSGCNESVLFPRSVVGGVTGGAGWLVG